MTENQPLPVAGYTPQSDAKVALVNEFKVDEERLLCKLDGFVPGDTFDLEGPAFNLDPRWLAVARTHFQEGFMALNRAVFQPQRIKLPEDDPKVGPKIDPEDYPAGHPEHVDNVGKNT